jgi:hypothetical protein
MVRSFRLSAPVPRLPGTLQRSCISSCLEWVGAIRDGDHSIAGATELILGETKSLSIGQTKKIKKLFGRLTDAFSGTYTA